MNADWEEGGLLLEVWSHLFVAKAELLPSDGQVIADHVRSAYELLNRDRIRSIKKESKCLNPGK